MYVRMYSRCVLIPINEYLVAISKYSPLALTSLSADTLYSLYHCSLSLPHSHALSLCLSHSHTHTLSVSVSLCVR